MLPSYSRLRCWPALSKTLPITGGVLITWPLNSVRLTEDLAARALNYAAIKGFSLVPTYCPDAVLRAPSDLDYLVDKSSLPVAQRVLEEAGYRLHRFSDIEFKFGRPSPRIPTVSDDPYSRETQPLVELHLDILEQESKPCAAKRARISAGSDD